MPIGVVLPRDTEAIVQTIELAHRYGAPVLYPTVRQAPKDALILTDGFSCQTQIEQGADRQALHLAEVLKMALREGSKGPAGDYPEQGYVTRDYPRSVLGLIALAGAGAALVGGALAWALRRK